MSLSANEAARVKQTSPAASPAGIIGLGAMGTPMARNMLKAGIAVVVYDRDASRMAALQSAGAECADSSAEVARRCTRTFCVVETAAQVEEVMFGAAGIAAGAAAGHHVACVSTIDRKIIRALAERAAPRGITFFDAAVSGSTEGAIAGTLAIFVGAQDTVAPMLGDCFAAIGKHVFYMGAAGRGIEIKLLCNMLAQVNTIAVAEALVMAKKAGLELETVIEAVKVSSGNSAAFEMRAPRMLRRDFTPGGTNDISFKDQELETAFAKELGVPVFMASVTQQIYQIARSMGLGKEDGSSVIKVYERFDDPI